MKLSYASFAAAVLVSSGYAAKPRLNMPGGNGNGRGNAFGSDSSDSSDSSDGGAAPASGGVSAVYSLNNNFVNGIQVYSRDVETGLMTFVDTVLTTGNGSIGEGDLARLGTDDSIVTIGNCLLAVNAGSNDISTFTIDPSTGFPTFANKVPSGGLFPGSITHRRGLVYVLNAAGQGHLQAFAFVPFNCNLVPIGDPVELRQVPHTSFPGPVPFFVIASPAQVAFTPNDDIVVSIKRQGGLLNADATGILEGSPGGSINHYTLNADGTTSDDLLTQHITDNTASFGFDFGPDGELIVVLPFTTDLTVGGGVRVFEGDTFETQVQDVSPIAGAGACFIRYHPTNECVYTTDPCVVTVGANTLNIPAYSKESGQWELVDEAAATDIFMPQIMAVSLDGEYMYVVSDGFVNATFGESHIVAYKSNADCSLEEIQRSPIGLDPILYGVSVWPSRDVQRGV